ncbi:hypothetical protein K1719_031888 [Acacia pycnantha]|nr:hypothetical protein K1719_031888 [Acacia pycnantha]
MVDGEKWKKQRKLASYEFSSRVLRDFSSSAFRTKVAKLVRLVSRFSEKSQVFDMQDILMRCTLDSIFKVGSRNRDALDFIFIVKLIDCRFDQYYRIPETTK